MVQVWTPQKGTRLSPTGKGSVCARGHGECGLLETGTKRKPLDQSEVASPVIRERITVDE